MLRGELYLASDPELAQGRLRARLACDRFNASAPDDAVERGRLLSDIVGAVGPDCWIEPPFRCDYGSQVVLGAGVFVNFDAIFLDCAAIVIGDQVQIGPGVQLLTADHPRDAAQRASGLEMARPIVIGARVWLGGGVIVVPGVTIGADSTIGAGSVVVRDIPSGVVAAGNPCRVIRQL